MGAQIITLAHGVWAIFLVSVSPGRSSPHSSHAGLNFVFPGSWHQGCPCWCLALGPPASWWPVPANTECAASAFIPFLHPVLSPFKPIKREPRALDERGFSSCFNHKWIVRVIPFLVILFAVISECHLWACTDMHSSLLFPVPGSLWCQHDQHSWASELPDHSVSGWGFHQPTQHTDSSHDIAGKPTLWQHPKGSPILMGFRPPRVLPLPV